MVDSDVNKKRKRVRYYKGLFLQKEDFKAEQDYHIEQRRHQNTILLSSGIVEKDKKLQVSQKPTDPTHVIVSPGVAIDGYGNQLIVEQGDECTDEGIELKEPSNRDSIPKQFVLISYKEYDDDDSKIGAPGKTRIFEKPEITIVEDIYLKTDDESKKKYIQLALLTVDVQGKLVGVPDNNCRQAAGVKVAGGITGIRIGTDVISPSGNPIELAAKDKNPVTLTIPPGQNKVEIGVQALPLVGGIISASKPDASTSEGVVRILNSSEEGSSLVAIALSQDNIPEIKNKAAVVAISNCQGISGIYTTVSQDKTPAIFVSGYNSDTSKQPSDYTALFVRGNVEVTDNVHASTFNGTKIGFVADRFINGSGRDLRTGDVVKLKGTPIQKYYSSNNRVPIAEVILADREDDSQVIGIVSHEATPDLCAPDYRTDPEDPTFIAPEGELLVVTLGAFSHCKVDATIASIEVGDLLTSSNNPGYAKKATNPKIGCIIGKALEPLKQGTGYIAVFVNIQ